MNWDYKTTTRCEALGGQCDEYGKFLPTQCEEDTCWCVDEAGNQLPQTSTFPRGERVCCKFYQSVSKLRFINIRILATTPIESVEVTLGFRGEFDDISAVPVVNQITKIIKHLNGNIHENGLKTEIAPDALYVKFSLIGSSKVDVAYNVEQMVSD